MRSRSAMWLACFVLGACSGGGGGDDAPPAQTTGAIRMLNASTYTFVSVFVDPSDVTVYSDPRNDAPIAPGETITVAGLAPGSWTWMVTIDEEVSFIAAADYLPVEAGETALVSVSDSDFHGRVEVTNGAADELSGVYLGFDGSWFPRNRLEVPLAPGETFLLLTHLPPNTYDVRCEYAAGGPFVGSFVIEPLTVTPVTCR